MHNFAQIGQSHLLMLTFDLFTVFASLVNLEKSCRKGYIFIPMVKLSSNQDFFVTRLTKGLVRTAYEFKKINACGMFIWYHGIGMVSTFHTYQKVQKSRV